MLRFLKPRFATTVFGVASGGGRAAISVMRVSGPDAAKALALCGGRPLKPRQASLRRLMSSSGKLIDTAILLWFKGPNSFTGEDLLEIHSHGGPAITRAITKELQQLGMQLAQRGEFTRRGVMNGKLDVLEAESILALVGAETEQQLSLAHAIKDSRDKLMKYRARLIDLLSELEAFIDFSDDTQMVLHNVEHLKTQAAALLCEFQRLVGTKQRIAELSKGVQIAIVGRVNAGKSTLMNVLAQSEVSIVSDQAGTTRDVVRQRLDIGGWPCTLMDTAGLRAADDPIEAEGIRRALVAAREAKIVLFLVQPTSEYNPNEQQLALINDPRTILVLTKQQKQVEPPFSGSWILVSASSGKGYSELLGAIQKRLEHAPKDDSGESDFVVAVMKNAAEQLRAYLRESERGNLDKAAFQLREGLQTIGVLCGRADIEEVLDVLFSKFCVGK